MDLNLQEMAQQFSVLLPLAYTYLKDRVAGGVEDYSEGKVTEFLEYLEGVVRKKVTGRTAAHKSLETAKAEPSSQEAWQEFLAHMPDLLTDSRVHQFIAHLQQIVGPNDQSMHFTRNNLAGATIVGPGGTVNQTIHQPPQAAGPFQQKTPRPDPLLRYRKDLFQWAQRQVFLDGKEDDATALALDEIYVDLDVTSGPGAAQLAAAGIKRGRQIDGETKEPRTLLAAVAEQRQVVVLGDPGGGKSTFLAHLVQCLCGPFVDPDIDWAKELKHWPADEATLVPVRVALPQFTAWLENHKIQDLGSAHLWNFLKVTFEKDGFAKALNHLEERLDAVPAKQNAPVIFLLDGLDELPPRKRALAHKAVKALQEAYDDARIVVTCRTLSYDDSKWRLPGIPSVQIVPLSPELIAAFNKKWHAHLSKAHPRQAACYEGLRDNFEKELQRDDLSRMATNPLLLTVMALIHTVDGALPESRVLVYDRAVNLLIIDWDAWKGEKETGAGSPALMRDLMARAAVDLEAMKRAIGELAHLAHQDSRCLEDAEAVGAIAKEQLLQVLKELDTRPWDEWGEGETATAWAEKVVQALKKRAGLLVLTEQKDGHFTFPHRTFQEYLAGICLVRPQDSLREAARLAGEHDIWRLPVVLAAGYLGRCQQNYDRVRGLLAELCAQAETLGEAGWRRVWIAGEALLEAGLAAVGDGAIGQRLVADIRSRLVALITGGHLTASQRTAAGNALAKIGDDRPGVGLISGTQLPDLEFCYVPRGPFPMGDALWPNREPHECTVTGAYDYWIARYPVTVAQFSAFCHAKRYTPKDSRCHDGPGNHPVVYVSWEDAKEFCDWLTGQWREGVGGMPPWKPGWAVRLPSEAEWERAARGGAGIPVKGEVPFVSIQALRPDQAPGGTEARKNLDRGRAYPWGGKNPDASRANYGGVEVDGGKTSPVGCFPDGQSPVGCLDMAGNVWEWTRSLYVPYPYDQGYPAREDEAAEGPRVLRGGAFDYYPEGLRCASRGHDAPHIRYGNIGFRVVVAPGSAGSGPLISEG